MFGIVLSGICALPSALIKLLLTYLPCSCYILLCFCGSALIGWVHYAMMTVVSVNLSVLHFRVYLLRRDGAQ